MLAVTALAGVAAVTAEGATTFTTTPPIDGPVLAGPRVVWAVPRADDGFNVRQAAPGVAPSTRARFLRGIGITTLIPSLAGSPQRIAVSEEEGESSNYSVFRSVFSAPLDGPVETLDRSCPLSGSPDFPRPIDVSGDAVVYPRCPPHGDQQVVVRDYSGPTPVEQVIPEGRVGGLRLAGRYVAWLEGSTYLGSSSAELAVYDRVLRTIAYRIPEEAMPGPVSGLDLQDDGKVVFSLHTLKRQVAWASPAEPTPHLLALPARTNYEVRIAGDRIAFEAGVEPYAGDPLSADVGISDLAGHWRRLGNFAAGSFGTDDFDFDGTRLTWWSYGCTRAFVHLIDADGPPALSRPRSGCRLRFTRKPTISKGAVRLHINCFGFALDTCYARRVKLTFRGTVVARSNTARRVPLTAAGRRLLRRHRVLRVRATATLRDEADRQERRSGPLTLRRP